MILALALGIVFVPQRAFAATSAELQAELDAASAELDELMSQTNESIAALQETQDAIDETQDAIDETRAALDEEAMEVGRMQSDLALIIASDYKTRGNLGLLSFILGATDYDDFISRLYYAERVSEQRQQAIAEVRVAQDEMMDVQRDLQEKKADLENLAAEQESQVDDLQTALANLQAYVDGLPAEIQLALEEENAARLAAAQEEAEALVAESDDKQDERAGDASEGDEASDDKPQEDTPSSSDDKPSNNDTPQSQPSDPSGGHLSDVADYIGPQASWSSDANYIASQQRILSNAGSSTDWGCVVDKGSGRCVVFRRVGGVWKAAMTTNVITNGHTFTGNFTVAFHSRAYWKLPDGYDVNDWWVCFIVAWSSNDYNGHLRYEQGKGYDDGQGFHYGYSTGGCTVIPNYATSQWLYDHVPNGSRVVVY